MWFYNLKAIEGDFLLFQAVLFILIERLFNLGTFEMGGIVQKPREDLVTQKEFRKMRKKRFFTTIYWYNNSSKTLKV